MAETTSTTVLFVGGSGTREAKFWNAVAEACSEEHVQFFGVLQGRWDDGPFTISYPHVFSGCIDQEFATFFREAAPITPEEASLHIATMTVGLIRPMLAIVWNGVDRIQRTWLHFLRQIGLTTLVAERAAFPGLFYFEPSGINGLSEFLWDEERIARSRRNIDAEERQRVRRVVETIKTSRAVSYRHGSDAPVENLRDSLGLGPGEKTVLFLGSWDVAAGITHPDLPVRRAQSPLYETSQAAALALKEATEKLPNCRLIIRPHPLDEADWSGMAAIPSVHFVPNSEVIDLIDQADVVAGLTTNLLYHAAAYEKPVVLMGRTALFGCGFAYDVNVADQLLPVLQEALSGADWNERLIARDRFFAEYFFHFCYTVEDDFLRLGIPGAAAAAARIASDVRAIELQVPDSRTSLTTLGNAVRAVNEHVEMLTHRINELNDVVAQRDKQVEFLERCRRDMRLILRFRAGLLLRRLKRIRGLKGPLDYVESALNRHRTS